MYSIFLFLSAVQVGALFAADTSSLSSYQLVKWSYHGIKSTGVNLKDLPPSGAIEGKGYTQDAPEVAVQVRYVFQRDKQSVRVARVFNGEITNEEALFHLSACSRFIPAAKPNSRLNALAAWQSYSNIRRRPALKNTPDGLGVDFIRWFSQSKDTLGGRLSIEDPGFVYRQRSFSASYLPEFAYWSGTMKPAIAIEGEDANCAWLLGSIYKPDFFWVTVSPLPVSFPDTVRSVPYSYPESDLLLRRRDDPYYPRKWPRL